MLVILYVPHVGGILDMVVYVCEKQKIWLFVIDKKRCSTLCNVKLHVYMKSMLLYIKEGRGGRDSRYHFHVNFMNAQMWLHLHFCFHVVSYADLQLVVFVCLFVCYLCLHSQSINLESVFLFFFFLNEML